MRSRATLGGHPIHPALIPFPLALLISALAADLLGHALGRPLLWATGWHLAIAGVVMGLVAAVPGIVDYRHSVPPESSGKTRATKHAAVNSAALVLFLAGWWIRGAPSSPPGPAVLLLEAVGAGLLGYGGWLGGTLVNRNMVTVDHRYAGAGKWSEATLRPQAGRPLVAARADELEVDQMKLLRVDGRRIVLARTEEGYVAFDDRCTHRGGSLAGGVMICGTVQCLWHGSQFDCRTGEVKAGPAEEPIETYEVSESGDEVHLLL